MIDENRRALMRDRVNRVAGITDRHENLLHQNCRALWDKRNAELENVCGFNYVGNLVANQTC